MRVKKVNRYYCDFCKKANCSGRSISKHEKRCTMNPNRECGMCQLYENEQRPISELLAILPEPEPLIVRNRDWDGSEDIRQLEEAVKIALPKLRDLSGDCPACILAALRQKKIYVTIANEFGFDFKKECQEIWNNFNNTQMQKSYAIE